LEAHAVSREDRLVRTFVELADNLVDDFDVVDLLALLTERSVELLDASAAGLLLADQRGVLRLMAATSEAVELVELFQIQNAEGPCLECFRSAEVVVIDDLTGVTERWPRFVPVALDAGFRAAHAVPLRLRGFVLGALNLFRTTPGPFADEDATTTQALADVATIALLQHRAARDARALTEQLREALESRVAIEQAKGVLAERLGVGMDEAFTVLRAYARTNRRRLADVAQGVVVGTLGATELAALRGTDTPPR
jgi:GAF domain-containing protein